MQNLVADYDAVTSAVCVNVVGGINAIWLSFALVAFFSVLLTWFALSVRSAIIDLI